MTLRIRQIVVAASDLAAGRERLASLFGMNPPFRDPGVAEFGIDNAVFVFGDQFIEVISPVAADSSCARHLGRHGDGGYMLILQTDDFDRETARWQALGVRRVWSAAFDDIRATHLHPKDVGGAIVSVDEPRPAAAWRWGGPQWRLQDGARARQRVRGLTLQATDPQALARRWATVFDRPEPVADGPAWQLALDEGFVRFEPGARDGITGFTLAVAGLVEPGAVDALGVRWTLEPLAA